ncbi:RICIN domain-containing protein [Roseobacter sinensis]|uniref:RICIN domain-containing protein n=1 Tax=Roseobacter sinensis TaxID=2931391 RepID=A0ABT3B9D8_9RHOB|nr:RICIN domain-containing protein [Roseobacter sp. WL0113]MCV3270170.1 RICIN domain-containing protein [Roseobacter sp. WL0113]
MKMTDFTAALVTLFGTAAIADEPTIQSPAPVIHLADTLDETDALGWCIDTLGRGWSEQIQSHSCKPQGGDTQFRFDEATGAIQPVAFDGKCVALRAPDHANVPFGLLDCDPGADNQAFAFDEASMEFRLAGDPSQCVVVSETRRSAGPFMSRDLLVKPCGDVKAQFKQGVIRE